jgi:peptidyl-prolyl cis-trans isomerase D
MLRVLREHASSWMLKGILILVAVTFISWGGYSYFREKKETYVAKVNSVTIEWREYNDAFQNTVKQYQRALGPAFSEKMIDELRLREKILDGLIEKILILQEAKRLGFSVSDAELREIIESIPAFQVNGQFDTRRYEWALRSNRMTPEQFEQSQRENLLISKIVNLITMNEGKVSEEEVLDTYLFENERLNLAFVKVAPGALKSQVSTNEIETKDYYQKHQEEFRTPTFIQVQYLLFRSSDFEGKVQVSPEEVNRFYNSRKDTLKMPKAQVKDQILQTLKKEKAKAEASRKADDAFYSLYRSRDLEGYSKEKNIPIKTTGLFKEGDEIPDIGRNPVFYSSALSLRLEEISPVVNIPPNFYILKLVNKKDSRIPPLDEVKEAVRRKVLETKAEEKARQVAEDFLSQIRKGKKIREVAREKGYPLEETGFFVRTAGVVPRIGPAREFMGTLASLTEKNPVPKEIVRTKDGYFVMRLSGYKSADQSKFLSVKEKLEQRLRNQKREEAFQNWVDQLRSSAKIDINKELIKG